MEKWRVGSKWSEVGPVIVVVLDRSTHMWGTQGFQGRPVMGTGCGQAKRRTVRVAVSTVDMWIGVCG